MNYEQKYKEAIERCKSWMKGEHPECFTEAQKAGEFIFPELRESEDENIRKGLIKGLSAMRDIHKHQTFSDDAINIDDAIAWLEKQGEQKPAEWSEDDEKILRLSLENLTELKNRFGKEYGKVGDCMDWLKSIKPNHWKPSEEQLSSLGRFIEGVYGCVDFANIKSLYNDLKKL